MYQASCLGDLVSVGPLQETHKGRPRVLQSLFRTLTSDRYQIVRMREGDIMQTDYRMMMAIRADDTRRSQPRSTSRSPNNRTDRAFAPATGSSGGGVRRYWAYAATASVIVAVTSINVS